MKRLIMFIFISLFVSTTYYYSQEKATDKYYDSLLSIESAKKLYKKKYYEDSLAKLLKVASLTKNLTIKSEAILEIAYVKFLMGYSAPIYKTFLKKALDLNTNLELSSDHDRSFQLVFKTLKKKHKPQKTKKPTYIQKITQKKKPKSIKDMEIKDNLIFKMKKELSHLRESNVQQNENNKKQKTKLLKQKKINNKNILTINKLRNTVAVFKKLRDEDYKKQYKIIQKEKLKIEKEKLEIEKEIKGKNEIIAKLNIDINKQTAEIKLLKETNIVKNKIEENNKLENNLTKNNVFETLHQIWEKNIADEPNIKKE